MTWILFLWVTGSRIAGPSITTQEFNSHKACIEAAQAFQREFGQETRFMCLEKGKVKK